MSIENDIEAWDGKSAAAIGQIYEQYREEPTFIEEIVSFLTKAPLQKGATWLLKRHLENKGKIEGKEVKKIYGGLTNLKHWETKLHVLQCIPYMPVEKAEQTKVEVFLRECLLDKKKFVRAWAYNAFYEFSGQFEEYQEEVAQLLEVALREEAASVKARIRNIMKKQIQF